MKYLIYLVLVMVAMVCQLSVVELISIHGIVPDLILIVVCSISLLESRAGATLWGFAIGLSEDLIGSGLLGALALSRTIVAFLAGNILHFRTVRHTLNAAMAVGLLSVLNNLLRFITHLHSSNQPVFDILMQIIFPSLYTVVFAALIYAVIPESLWEKIYRTEALPFG